MASAFCNKYILEGIARGAKGDSQWLFVNIIPSACPGALDWIALVHWIGALVLALHWIGSRCPAYGLIWIGLDWIGLHCPGALLDLPLNGLCFPLSDLPPWFSYCCLGPQWQQQMAKKTKAKTWFT
eukprot:1150146-Pelagomonas_calceolata.AAC.1